MPLSAEVTGARARRSSRAPAARRRPLAAGRRGDAGAARRRAGRRADSPATPTSRLRTLRARGLPTLPEPAADGRDHSSPAEAFIDDVTRVVALRLARRDAAGPHRHPRLRLRARAADGRHRLLPAERQGDALDGAAAGQLEANVPARALSELARIAQQTRGRDAGDQRRARTRSCSRSAACALLAPDRRPVPQLPQLSARAVEHELRVDREELAGVVRRDQPARAEERAAASRLHARAS